MGFWIRRVATIVAVCLLASGCGGSEASSDTTAGSSDTGSVERADRLAARLGSADAGLDAVFLALNSGFGNTQIVDGIDDDSLQSDGSITDATPQDAARNFIDLSGADEGALGATAVGEIMLVGFRQAPGSLEALRATARYNADTYGGSSLGNSALQFLLQMMTKNGFDAGEITEMLVLGIDGPGEGFGEDCPAYRIGAEVLVGWSNFADDCKRPPGRYPADLFASESQTSAPDQTDVPPASESADSGDDAAAPAIEIPATISFAGGATGEPLKTNTIKGEIETDNFFFEATVANGQVDMTVWMSYWAWLRGGEEEVYVDQNCGARVVEQLVGTGTAGAATRIDFEVVTSEFTDYTGALCQPGDGEYALSDPGDASKPFTGQADHTGINGTFGGPAIELPVAND